MTSSVYLILYFNAAEKHSQHNLEQMVSYTNCCMSPAYLFLLGDLGRGQNVLDYTFS